MKLKFIPRVELRQRSPDTELISVLLRKPFRKPIVLLRKPFVLLRKLLCSSRCSMWDKTRAYLTKAQPFIQPPWHTMKEIPAWPRYLSGASQSRPSRATSILREKVKITKGRYHLPSQHTIPVPWTHVSSIAPCCARVNGNTCARLIHFH